MFSLYEGKREEGRGREKMDRKREEGESKDISGI